MTQTITQTGTLGIESEYTGLIDGKYISRDTRLLARHWALKSTDDPKYTRLQSGDVVAIFNTVAAGDIGWGGTIDLEYDRELHTGDLGYQQQAINGMWVHGFQRDLEPQAWADMVFAHLPARLERDGKIIYGALDPFFETGTEGVIWSIMAYDQDGYNALYDLRNGDKLTVYDHVTDGNVFARFDPLVLEDRPGEYMYGAGGSGTAISKAPPEGADIVAFSRPFVRNYPAVLTRRTP